MTTELKIGTRLKSTGLDCIHLITNVTDKKVCYTPEVPTGGLVVNKNKIRIFTTSVRKANNWLSEGSWIIVK